MLKRNNQHSFSLLNVDHVQLNTKWNYSNVISPYYRIYFIDGGEGEISDANTIFHLEQGYLYIIPSFTLCSMNCSGKLSQYFVQFFEDSANGISLFANDRRIFKGKASAMDVQLFNRLLEINPGRGINRSDDPQIYEKDIYYKEYQQLNNEQNVGVYMETQGILLQLVSKFLRLQGPKHHDNTLIPQKIAETLNYIIVNLNKDLSVADLASRVNQNVDYFSRQFQLYTGARPVSYINERRVERAQYLMATSRMTFAQIGSEIGLEGISHFSKTFKKFTGMSPREYQKQMLSFQS